jgi:hypothetical protein
MSAKIFDCLVLSGGGAKGSYGAGAGHALFSYYQLKGSRELCFIGTSAGALNASVLACYDSSKLTDLWQRQVSNKSVLGTKKQWLKTRFARHLWSKPFHLFSNDYLQNLIKQNVDFDRLAGKHLILLTTDLINGELTAFYVSDLMERFVRFDEEAARKQGDELKRRLRHLRKIENKEGLVSALLASAAIPIFFPPVKIGDRYHVDGGVGNNTPTREAAYFLRFLGETKEGVPGDVYCIQQDEPSIATRGEPDMSFFGLLQRTIDVTQYIHMKPIIAAWNRINVEVRNHQDRLKGFSDWLQSTSYGADVKETVGREIRERLGRLGGVAERINVPLISVQPSTSLGDTLDFDPEAMRRNVRHGYQDMLKALLAEKKINSSEYETLSNKLP